MKHELIILQGIQGSGKTTWAKNWVKEDPKHRVRFNQDDIRNMFGVYWVPSREPLVKAMHNSFLNEAMLGIMGVFSITYMAIPYASQTLLVISLLMLVSLLVIFVSLKTRKEP